MELITAAVPVASITSSTLGGLNALFSFVQLAYRIHGVPEDCMIFAKLVDQVQYDLQHALEVRGEIIHLLEMYPDCYRLWIKQSIIRTLDTLEDFGRYVLHFKPDNGSDLSLRKRIEYLLNDYQKLADREKSLRFAHSSLLTAINTMDFMLIQSRMFAHSGKPGSASGSSSGIESPEISRRASRQRPVPKGAPPRPNSAPPIQEEDNQRHMTPEHLSTNVPQQWPVEIKVTPPISSPPNLYGQAQGQFMGYGGYVPSAPSPNTPQQPSTSIAFAPSATAQSGWRRAGDGLGQGRRGERIHYVAQGVKLIFVSS